MSSIFSQRGSQSEPATKKAGNSKCTFFVDAAMGLRAEFKHSLMIQRHHHHHHHNRRLRIRNVVVGIDFKINLVQCERFCLEKGIYFERQFFENMAWSQQINAPIMVQNQPFVIQQQSFTSPGYGNGIYNSEPIPTAPLLDLPPSYSESQEQNKRY